MGNLSALILPSENAPRRSSVKRQLLFFDRVLLVHPDDAAVVNHGEVVEDFPGLSVQWSTRAPFPHGEGYRETMLQLGEETARLQRSGKVRFLRPEEVRPRLDPGSFFMSYMTAISDASLVRSAIPDCAATAPPFQMPAGVYAGCGVAQTGQRSRYEVDAAPPAELADVDHRWGALAWVRVGRALKFIRRSTVERACPIALDAPNAGICFALGARAYEDVFGVNEMADVSVALDAVDEVALDRALVDMPWDEVLKLRSRVLPKVCELRSTLDKSVRLARRRPTVEAYRAELGALRADLAKKREALAAEWNKFGLGIVGKVGAASLVSLALPHSVLGVLGSVVSAGLAVGASLTAEGKSALTAHQTVKAHPLFFFDELPKVAGDLARKP